MRPHEFFVLTIAPPTIAESTSKNGPAARATVFFCFGGDVIWTATKVVFRTGFTNIPTAVETSALRTSAGSRMKAYAHWGLASDAPWC